MTLGQGPRRWNLARRTHEEGSSRESTLGRWPLRGLVARARGRAKADRRVHPREETPRRCPGRGGETRADHESEACPRVSGDRRWSSGGRREGRRREGAAEGGADRGFSARARAEERPGSRVWGGEGRADGGRWSGFARAAGRSGGVSGAENVGEVRGGGRGRGPSAGRGSGGFEAWGLDARRVVGSAGIRWPIGLRRRGESPGPGGVHTGPAPGPSARGQASSGQQEVDRLLRLAQAHRERDRRVSGR